MNYCVSLLNVTQQQTPRTTAYTMVSAVKDYLFENNPHRSLISPVPDIWDQPLFLLFDLKAYELVFSAR